MNQTCRNECPRVLFFATTNVVYFDPPPTHCCAAAAAASAATHTALMRLLCFLCEVEHLGFSTEQMCSGCLCWCTEPGT